MRPNAKREDVLARARAVIDAGRSPVRMVTEHVESPPSLLDNALVSQAQTTEAIGRLHADPSLRVRFPYAGVHRLTGAMNPGRVVFLCANTGQGKTTFLLDLFDRWTEDGYRIAYEGTEQEGSELRIKWAALRVGCPSGIAINNDWTDIPNGAEMRDRVHRELEIIDREYADSVYFSEERFVTLAKIERACERAADMGRHALIIDHIDRIDVGESDSEYRGTKKLVRRLTELARDCGLLLLVASQLNREARKGDRISAYYPPQLHHMRGGGSKEEEASIVLGLWRPIRNAHANEGPKEFAALLKQARAGTLSPKDVLENGTMGVVLLKHRTVPNGVTEGDRAKLVLTNGRLTDERESDKYVTSPAVRGPRP